MRPINCSSVFHEDFFDMRRLNLDQLQAVVKVVELGGFSAAARELHLTQPAVSLQVRELEERLGIALVERLGKRAYATAAGAELIAHAARIDREVDDAVDAMRRRREGGLSRVRLGTGGAILAQLLPGALNALRREHPRIELTITTGTTDVVAAQVADNRLDLGLVTMPVVDRTLDTAVVRTDPMIAVLPPSERRAPAALSPAALARYPLMFDPHRPTMHVLAREWFRAAGIEPRVSMEVDHFAVRNLVSAGLGASIVTVETVLGGLSAAPVVVRPLDPPLVRTLAVVARRDKARDDAFLQVRAALMSVRRLELALPGAKAPRRRKR